jgi:hypothetical protein
MTWTAEIRVRSAIKCREARTLGHASALGLDDLAGAKNVVLFHLIGDVDGQCCATIRGGNYCTAPIECDRGAPHDSFALNIDEPNVVYDIDELPGRHFRSAVTANR